MLPARPSLPPPGAETAMNPASTRRFRRLTGLAGAGWALLAIGLSVSALFAPRSTLTVPLNCSFVAGVAVVESTTDEAREAGVDSGDQLLEIDGAPVMRVLRGGTDMLRSGVRNTYRIQKQDGKILTVSLAPAPREFSERQGDLKMKQGA